MPALWRKIQLHYFPFIWYVLGFYYHISLSDSSPKNSPRCIFSGVILLNNNANSSSRPFFFGTMMIRSSLWDNSTIEPSPNCNPRVTEAGIRIPKLFPHFFTTISIFHTPLPLRLQLNKASCLEKYIHTYIHRQSNSLSTFLHFTFVHLRWSMQRIRDTHYHSNY